MPGGVFGFAGPGSRTATLRLSLVASTVLALSACLPADKRPDLAIAITPRYAAANGGAASPVRADWPRLFRSAELNRLVDRAAGDNFDIAVALARITQAEAQARIAAAALYPTLDGSIDGSRSLRPGTLSSKRSSLSESVGNTFGLGLSASYEIDFWGKNRATADAGRLAFEASRFDRDVVALTTMSSVAGSYFQVLAAQDRLRIARENIALAERTLNVIRARLSVGTATQLDIAQQESVVAQQKASIPPLDRQLRQARVTLAVLVGASPASVSINGGSLNAIAAPNVRPGLPAQLLLRRPDIAEAEARLASEEAKVFAARAALFPNISLTGQGGLESAVLKNLLRPEAVFASAAASLAQPILDGGTLRAQVDLQKGAADELIASYRKAIVSAFSDVENALIGVQENTRHERLQAEMVVAARRAYSIIEQRLREGTIDIVTLLTTQQTLFQAQDQLSQVRLQRMLSYVDLFKALGGGWGEATRSTIPAMTGDSP
ncbi:efflux transporter outer membrane subunit [Bosea sp. 685]|uniref:efflux transporter outer membrane subunit n=1 Tax=Bosea sp. 685 TaxID=3080057 RepID=UPI00289350AB|nr:efflux transporter outer membrane subunit [Bosea sp. 685]WNJ93617.1 efflux transporter outer membrane subunit [Bosea sp. 685]